MDKKKITPVLGTVNFADTAEEQMIGSFMTVKQPSLKSQHSELSTSEWLEDVAFAFEMPLVKLTRATPSWDHWAQLLVAPCSEQASPRLTRSSCCLETTSSYKGLWGKAPRGPGLCLSFINVPEAQTASLGGILLIRWVCSPVDSVGHTIPAWVLSHYLLVTVSREHSWEGSKGQASSRASLLRASCRRKSPGGRNVLPTSLPNLIPMWIML